MSDQIPNSSQISNEKSLRNKKWDLLSGVKKGLEEIIINEDKTQNSQEIKE